MESEDSAQQPPNLPKLVKLLLAVGKREEKLIELLAEAVATGDRDSVFEAASNLVQNRQKSADKNEKLNIEHGRQRFSKRKRAETTREALEARVKIRFRIDRIE